MRRILTLPAHVGASVMPFCQIHELHSPAMRDRHWKELLEVTDQGRPAVPRESRSQVPTNKQAGNTKNKVTGGAKDIHPVPKSKRLFPLMENRSHTGDTGRPISGNRTPEAIWKYHRLVSSCDATKLQKIVPLCIAEVWRCLYVR